MEEEGSTRIEIFDNIGVCWFFFFYFYFLLRNGGNRAEGLEKKESYRDEVCLSALYEEVLIGRDR